VFFSINWAWIESNLSWILAKFSFIYFVSVGCPLLSTVEAIMTLCSISSCICICLSIYSLYCYVKSNASPSLSPYPTGVVANYFIWCIVITNGLPLSWPCLNTNDPVSLRNSLLTSCLVYSTEFLRLSSSSSPKLIYSRSVLRTLMNSAFLPV
jgi:hypothetical protein